LFSSVGRRRRLSSSFLESTDEFDAKHSKPGLSLPESGQRRSHVLGGEHGFGEGFLLDYERKGEEGRGQRWRGERGGEETRRRTFRVVDSLVCDEEIC